MLEELCTGQPTLDMFDRSPLLRRHRRLPSPSPPRHPPPRRPPAPCRCRRAARPSPGFEPFVAARLSPGSPAQHRPDPDKHTL